MRRTSRRSSRPTGPCPTQTSTHRRRGPRLRRHVRDDVRRCRARGRCSSWPGWCCGRVGRRPGRGARGSGRSSPVPGSPRWSSASCTASSSVPPASLPVLWLRRSRSRSRCSRRVAVGAVLLAGAYVLGTVNRWREGGLAAGAVCAAPAIAGAALFLGLGLASSVALRRWAVGPGWLPSARGRGGGAGAWPASGSSPQPAAAAPASSRPIVGAVRLVIRLGSNLISFARLAAFGLTHAASADRCGRARGACGRRRPRRCGRRGRGVRGRQRHRVPLEGAGRRRPGPAAGVLRAVLPRLHERGSAVPALAHPHRVRRTGSTRSESP